MSRQAALAIALRGAFDFVWAQRRLAPNPNPNRNLNLITPLHYDVEAAARRLKLKRLKFSRLTIFMAHRNVALLLSQE
jgi:hypothetical protein